MKKILAILLALTLVVGLGMTAWAADDEEPTTGTIIIQNATKGHTYTAYKVFDATYDGEAVSYTTPYSEDTVKLIEDSGLFGHSDPDAEGNISVWALDDADESDIIDWVKENYAAFGGTAIEGTFDASDSTVTFSGLDFGYYYIESSLGSAVTITTAAPTAEVYDKNFVEPTDPEKTIIAIDGVDQDHLSEANAHVGSVVTFEVTAKTVNWTGDKTTDGSIEEVTDAEITTEWEFTDKPTNMEIDVDTVKVSFNDTELAADAFTATLNDDGSLTVNVPMVDEDGNSIYEAPEDGLIPIVVTYDATITADAGKSPAYNEIPGDNPPPPPVIIYTYGFQIVKTDDNEEPLPGAQFELWSDMGGELADPAPLSFIDNGDGTYTYSPDGTVTTLDMTTNTTISILGLDQAWNYTIKEITVPSGYNKAPDKDVSGSSLTQVGEVIYEYDEDGNMTITVNETDTSIESEELYQEIVVNEAGSLLPSTGGIGTTIFYVVGGLLAVGAGVVLVTKKRMGKEEA